MNRAQWDALVLRVAWVRHRTWCLASEDPETGTRHGECDNERGVHGVECRGPKSADLNLGQKVIQELYGKRPEEETSE